MKSNSYKEEQKEIRAEEETHIKIPISIQAQESNYSIWNRLNKMYKPNDTFNNTNIPFEKILFDSLTPEGSLEISEIANRSSFYSNLLTNYPTIDFSSIVLSGTGMPITKTLNQGNPIPKFANQKEEKDFLNDAIFKLKQRRTSILSFSSMSSNDYNSIETTTLTIQSIKEDINNESIRLKNLLEQIYKYQMKIIANGISLIQKSSINNSYLISFDPSLNIPQSWLSLEQYTELIKYKEPLLRYLLEPITYITRTNDKSENDITIFNHDSIKKYYCHQCKLRKEEGKYCSLDQSKKTIIELSINNLYVFILNADIYIIDYLQRDDLYQLIKEHLHTIQPSSTKSTCKHFMCSNCIKNCTRRDTYDPKLLVICPKCIGACYCISCQSEMQLCKLVACYLSIKWDIESIVSYCIDKFPLLKDNKEELFLSKFILYKLTEECDLKGSDSNVNEITLENAKQYKMDILKYQMILNDYCKFNEEKQMVLNYNNNELKKRIYIQIKENMNKTIEN